MMSFSLGRLVERATEVTDHALSERYARGRCAYQLVPAGSLFAILDHPV